ncbi:MAG: hypothetical protein AB4911_02400 [Oscillochloridaceae bacterium umkhey_bin13]
MKRSANPWRAPLRDHSAFFSYRWLAWVIAALALTLPGRPVQSLPRDAGLLLLIGVINVVATALAQGYVRVAMRRPTLLALDLAAGAAVLWLSGSSALPFLPYALSGLILPALIYQWRGALVGAAAFIALDLVGLALINPEFGGQLAGSALVTRLLIPAAFAAIWVMLRALLHRDDDLPTDQHLATQQNLRSARLVIDPPDLAQAPRMARSPRPELPEPRSVPTAPPGSLVLARTAPPAPSDRKQRLMFDLSFDQNISLEDALEQLGTTLGQQADFTVEVAARGTPHPLSRSYQTVLLRTAYEALLNVQQHARAQAVLITLNYELDQVTLLVQDDGIGLLDGTYERPGLHALRALRYRLVELDGQLLVIEPESGGLRVQAMLPREV